ncbi:hypothetical protein Vretimale_6026 [Volvox reticuliferus]|uniref:SET domain-containing protein n=1 Tax=Volvox reticuliferus TaxID=1737510 RepID=A0A8J4LL96_9CHLO|nr:hypothetical protein Vretifemale_6185 [Volvox reticuliferus]GIM01217.1 hypothetical protein Vretimale_6026 [Volvox reticuliferus]
MTIILHFPNRSGLACHSFGQGYWENRSPCGAITPTAASAVTLRPLPALPIRHHCFGHRKTTITITTAAAAAAGTARSVSGSCDAVADDVQQDALRRWIQDHGGFVHESISVTSATQCGSRGLVANAAIGLDQLEAGSLVVVPRALHLDNGAAVAAVCPQLGSGTRQDAFREQLGQLQQVACCLAVERAKGSESFWLPYVRTLPGMPPNPWLLTDADLAEVLEEMTEVAAARTEQVEAGSTTAEAGNSGRVTSTGTSEAAKAAVGWSAGAVGCRTKWAAAVEAARRRYGGMAAEVLEVVGADRGQLRLDEEGLMWALGQVVSRSLGSGRSSGLLPLIDMANHDSAARPPLMMLDDQDRLVFAVTSIRGGELAPLETGQELFISYQAEDMSPLQAWLKWGFVPHTIPCSEAAGGWVPSRRRDPA